ncbi:translationally-controlled tumor, partial [Lynx pardinus]
MPLQQQGPGSELPAPAKLAPLLSLQPLSQSSTWTSSALMRCSPTSTRSRRSLTGCAWGCRTESNFDESLIGGNASTKGPQGEGTQSTVIIGFGINHEYYHLQELASQKKPAR